MLYPLTSVIFTNQQRCESVHVLETIVMVMVMRDAAVSYTHLTLPTILLV